MKAAFAVLGLLALLGVVYGLAFFGIIPVQKMADKSPALASALVSMHLARPKKHVAPLPQTAKAASPEQQALDAQKKQLAADRAQLDKDRADWEAQKQQAAAPASGTDTPAEDSGAKLNAIYATMSPDDIARIFAKLPDPDVMAALTQLDEKKAGKILAALPDDRAARLTRRMSHPSLASTAAASPATRLQTSL